MVINFDDSLLEKTFLIDPVQEKSMTYREIILKSFVLSNSFGQSNTLLGKTILITLKDLSSYISVLMACWRSGLIPAVYSPNLKECEYENIINEFKFDYIYSDFEFENLNLKSLTLNQPITVQNPSIDDYSLDIDVSSIAVLLFSSGTSGKQKCVPLSFSNLFSNITTFTKRLSISENNTFLCGSPLWHAHGLYNSFLTAFFLKTSVYYSGPLNIMNVTALLKSVSVEKKVVFHITPSMIPILLMYAKKNSGNELPDFYKMVCGTSFLDINSKKKVEDLYKIKIFQQYGMTETLFMTINDEFSDQKPDSVGQAIDDVIIEICSGDDLQLPGLPGLIRVKSNSSFGSYYYGNEENRAFKNGYFYTGDIGYFDGDKSLFITGREKDLIKKGGFSISANTISSKLASIDGIDDAYTIGIKDPITGEEIYSFYISKIDMNENEIRLQLKKDISDKLLPKKIFRVNSFPKTETGKIIKSEMEAILNKLL